MAGNALLDAEYLLKLADVRLGMHVADFGVGRTGHLIFPAAELVGEHGRVYGVDLNQDALKMVEGRRRQYLVHNIHLVHGDIEAGSLDIPEASLDRIFLIHTLPVASKHEDIVREAGRVLKTDGRIIVVDWHPEAEHPVAPSQQFRLHPNQVDLAFARAGCELCYQFLPAKSHWGRVYRLLDSSVRA